MEQLLNFLEQLKAQKAENIKVNTTLKNLEYLLALRKCFLIIFSKKRDRGIR
jgi:hypothetical protein